MSPTRVSAAAHGGAEGCALGLRRTVVVPRDPQHSAAPPALPHGGVRLLARADETQERLRVEAEAGQAFHGKVASA